MIRISGVGYRGTQSLEVEPPKPYGPGMHEGLDEEGQRGKTQGVEGMEGFSIDFSRHRCVYGVPWGPDDKEFAY